MISFLHYNKLDVHLKGHHLHKILSPKMFFFLTGVPQLRRLYAPQHNYVIQNFKYLQYPL